MIFILKTEYVAMRATIRYILDNSIEYKHALFIEDAEDNPWKYNEEWFRSQNGRKKIFILTESVETGGFV
jgi:hypothetical protein